MKYIKKVDSGDAYNMKNENDNIDLIGKTLKNTVYNVNIELNEALNELRTTISCIWC